MSYDPDVNYSCDELAKVFETSMKNLTSAYNMYERQNKLDTDVAEIHLGALRIPTHAIIRQMTKECPGQFEQEAKRLGL